jgi:glycerol uptake facilitator-like aquaporin
MMSLTRRATVEGVGTALLLATVIGSGIMGERLSGGNVALALLADTLATGAALAALIRDAVGQAKFVESLFGIAA